jgi:uncharacterized protein (TIGR02466 family)
MQVNYIFPMPVAKTPPMYELTEKEKCFLNNQEITKNESNYTSVNNYILNSEILSDLKKYLEKISNDFFHAVYSPSNDCSVYITQSWVNYSSKGEHHHKHSHPNSFISGVFYIQANNQHDKIWMHRANEEMFFFDTNKFNPFNLANVYFSVNTGETILFPSKIQHSVQPVETNEKRISLAFNTFIKGTIGEGANLNQLVLN